MDFAFVCRLWLANKTMSLPSLHMFAVGLFTNTKTEIRKPNQIPNTNVKFKLAKLKATVCYTALEDNTYFKPHFCMMFSKFFWKQDSSNILLLVK